MKDKHPTTMKKLSELTLTELLELRKCIDLLTSLQYEKLDEEIQKRIDNIKF